MKSSEMFDEAAAASYDQRFEKLAPLRDALHLVARLVLETLPAEARVLCVGAGTGAELLYLAEAFPGWRFTAVDPSGPMLRRCRERVEAAGLAGRCALHEGTVATLPGQELFDGATAILVSQFVVDGGERSAFFRDVARRLRPAAPLVFADLASPGPTSELLAIWESAWRYAGAPEAQIAKMVESYGRIVAVLPPEEVGALVEAGGFEPPLRCFQSLLIHGWVARARAPGASPAGGGR